MKETEPYILIVDDEVDACANLADILTERGYRVDVAYDGPSALERVQQREYDVALLDLKMPGMNGLELYKRIKAISAGTVAIVVTAFAGSKLAQEALDAGAVEIIAKPVNFPRLMQVVEQILEQPLVMVVDDDQDLCESLWSILREQNYRVCLAHSTLEAEQKLDRDGYQVVLIDMKLPVGSGAEVFQLIRNTHPLTRTILITGARSEMETLIEQALAQGADAVAYKPFDMPRLLETLKRLSAKSADAGGAVEVS